MTRALFDMKTMALAAIGMCVATGLATYSADAADLACLDTQYAMIEALAATQSTISASRRSEERYVWFGTVPVYESLKVYRASLGLGWREDAPKADDEPPGPLYAGLQPTNISRQRRERLGADHPYIAEWTRNLARSQTACDRDGQKPCEDLPRVEGSYEPDVRVLAESDARYYRARAYLNGRRFEAAYELFKEIASIDGDPWRAHAAYLALHALAAPSLNRYRTSVVTPADLRIRQEAAAILADPSLAGVHPGARLRLDVIAYWTGNPEFLSMQLDGLARRAVDPDQVPPGDDLTYFLWPEVRDPLGWWLRAEPSNDGHSEVVRQVSARHDVIDWLQADVAAITSIARTWRHSADRDLSASLADDPVPDHAWRRWTDTGRAVWLRPYARRAQPTEESGTRLAALAAEAERRVHECALDADWAAAYPALIEGAVRVLSSISRIDQAQEILVSATALPVMHRDFIRRAAQQLAMRNGPFGSAAPWTRLAGIEASAVDLYSSADLRSLAETTVRQTQLIEGRQFGSDERERGSFRSGIGDYDPYAEIRSVLDLMPVRHLLTFAQTQDLPATLRASIARTAWLRAWLLGRHLAAATTLLRSTNPEMAHDLKMIEQARTPAAAERARLLMVLRNPRFTLRLFIFSPDPYMRQTFAGHDPINQNDGNWWCAYRLPELKANAIRFFWGTTIGWIGGGNEIYERSFALDGHSIMSLVDMDEVSRLASIGTAPAFLSRRTMKWARDMTWIDRWLGRDEGLAEALHHVVRATRWSCPSEGPYGSLSREAFSVLHARYGDSPWARRTPYWFSGPVGTFTWPPRPR